MSQLKVRKLTELLSLEQPSVLYYLENELLSYGGSLFIYGRAGSFKSFLAIELMHALATGNRWLLYRTLGTPLTTLMVQAEQVEAMYQDRMMAYTQRRISKPSLVDPYMLFTTSQNIKLDDFRGIAQLEQAIKTHHPKVVFIDCLYRVVKSTVDTTSVGRFLDDMARMSGQYGTAFVVIHHPRKESENDYGFDELTGWSGIANWADTILRITRHDLGPHGPTINLRWEKTKNARKEVGDANFRVDQENLKFLVH